MIAAELRGGNKPSLNEALDWIGSRVDDIYGASVGRLEDVWIDPGTGSPRWLLVSEGRFGGRSTLIPFEDATAGAGHVWVPYEREVVRGAPEVQPGAPLTQELEAGLRAHYAATSSRSVTRSVEPRTRGEQPRRTADAPTPDAPPRMPERPAPPVEAPPPREEELVYRPPEPAAPAESAAAGSAAAEPSRRERRREPDPFRYAPELDEEPPADEVTLAAAIDANGDPEPAGATQTVEIEFSGELTVRGEIRSVRLRASGDDAR